MHFVVFHRLSIMIADSRQQEQPTRMNQSEDQERDHLAARQQHTKPRMLELTQNSTIKGITRLSIGTMLTISTLACQSSSTMGIERRRWWCVTRQKKDTAVLPSTVKPEPHNHREKQRSAKNAQEHDCVSPHSSTYHTSSQLDIADPKKGRVQTTLSCFDFISLVSIGLD